MGRGLSQVNETLVSATPGRRAPGEDCCAALGSAMDGRAIHLTYAAPTGASLAALLDSVAELAAAEAGVFSGTVHRTRLR